MKKIILLVIAVFILSGCSAEYNIDLRTFNEVDENLEIIEDNNQNPYFDYLNKYNEFVPVIYNEQDLDTTQKDPTLEYYNLENHSTLTQANLNFNYIFNNDEYKNSNIINTCYKKINFLNSAKNININTSSQFLCFDKYVALDKVIINITTDKKIVSHNADRVNNNIYTWEITKDNQYNKPIKISSINSNQNTETEEEEENNWFIIIIAISSFLILLIGLFIYKNRKYNSN